MAAPRTAQERPNSPDMREGGGMTEREEEERKVWREGGKALYSQPPSASLPSLLPPPQRHLALLVGAKWSLS